MGTLKDFSIPIFLFSFIIKQCQADSKPKEIFQGETEVMLSGCISTGRSVVSECFQPPGLLDTIMK